MKHAFFVVVLKSVTYYRVQFTCHFAHVCKTFLGWQLSLSRLLLTSMNTSLWSLDCWQTPSTGSLTIVRMRMAPSLRNHKLIRLKSWYVKKRSVYDIILYFAVFWSRRSCFFKGAGADVTEKTVFLTSFVMIAIKNAMKVPDANLTGTI